MLSFLSWRKKINEGLTFQTEVSHGKWTDDPESLKIMRAFNQQFLPTVIGNIGNLKISEYIVKLQAITPQQYDGVIQFFTNLGYPQPNDKIKKFQEDLMNSSQYKTFTTTADTTKQLNDGIFGRATALSLVNYSISRLNLTNNKEMTVSQMTIDTQTQSNQPGKNYTVPKTDTISNVQTGTGVQSII